MASSCSRCMSATPFDPAARPILDPRGFGCGGVGFTARTGGRAAVAVDVCRRCAVPSVGGISCGDPVGGADLFPGGTEIAGVEHVAERVDISGSVDAEFGQVPVRLPTLSFGGIALVPVALPLRCAVGG